MINISEWINSVSSARTSCVQSRPCLGCSQGCRELPASPVPVTQWILVLAQTGTAWGVLLSIPRPLVEPGLPGAGCYSYQSVISSGQKLAGEFPGLPRELLWVSQHREHVLGHSPSPQLCCNYSRGGDKECVCAHLPAAWRHYCWSSKRFSRGHLTLKRFLMWAARFDQ